MIYIGKFMHVTNQQRTKEENRRHGEFNLIIKADDEQTAVDKFKVRIKEFREKTELFEGDCFIYMVHFLELDDFHKDRARMLYYKSIAGDPVMPYISCSAPSGEADACKILNWMENRPELDGQDTDVFMHFEEYIPKTIRSYLFDAGGAGNRRLCRIPGFPKRCNEVPGAGAGSH